MDPVCEPYTHLLRLPGGGAHLHRDFFKMWVESRTGDAWLEVDEVVFKEWLDPNVTHHIRDRLIGMLSSQFPGMCLRVKRQGNRPRIVVLSFTAFVYWILMDLKDKHIRHACLWRLRRHLNDMLWSNGPVGGLKNKIFLLDHSISCTCVRLIPFFPLFYFYCLSSSYVLLILLFFDFWIFNFNFYAYL